MHYKLSVIILEKVGKLFNSINDIGSEFHSRMVRGKKLDIYVVVELKLMVKQGETDDDF